MGWSVRYVVVQPWREPEPEKEPDDDARELKVAKQTLATFAGPKWGRGLSEDSIERVGEVIAEGWEPFAVTAPTQWAQCLWFRRSQDDGVAATFEVDELPGQYL